MLKPRSLWAATAALALTPFLAPVAHAAGPLSVYANGLNNPYGLAFGPDGGLYVAEAGTGGAAGTGPGLLDGTGATVYFGDTGSVAEVLGGIQSEVITGLPSLSPKGGGETTGLQGLTFSGTTLYGLFGLGANPANFTPLLGSLPANAADLGQLVSLNTKTNAVTPVFNVAAYETQTQYDLNNPDGLHQLAEANPYGVAALPGGGFAVTDGGGNVVLKVSGGGGALTLLSALPAVQNLLPFGPPKYQSVPTGVTLGAGGDLLVGAFGGFPAPAGGASVFRMNPTTGATSVFATGFTAITGLAYGPNGDLYVLDASTNSYYGPPSPAELFQYDPTTGTKTLLTDLAAGPTYSSLTAGPDGALYISSQGTGAGSGQVLRYSLAAVPEAPGAALLALGLLPLGLLARRRAV